MSRLIGLYPRAWRARYEEELRDALAVRPQTTRDRLDLLRGALDARLHPELAPPQQGAPVPVGPDIGGGLPVPLSAFPVTMFLAITAAAAFFLAAVLLPIQARFFGTRFQEVLLVAASVCLGAALWRTRAGLDGRVASLLARLGALVMMSTALVLVGAGWPSVSLTAVELLTGGSVIIGVAGLAQLLSRHHDGWWVGPLFLAMAAALGVSFAWDITRGVSLVLGAYALVAIRFGATDRLTIRRTIIGVGGGVLLVSILALGTATTSPWSSHGGYSLACGGVEPTACFDLADRVASMVVSQMEPSAIITHMEVAADRTVDVCWRADMVEDSGCWYTGAL